LLIEMRHAGGERAAGEIGKGREGPDCGAKPVRVAHRTFVAPCWLAQASSDLKHVRMLMEDTSSMIRFMAKVSGWREERVLCVTRSAVSLTSNAVGDGWHCCRVPLACTNSTSEWL
jgi:hypothetical protein